MLDRIPKKLIASIILFGLIGCWIAAAPYIADQLVLNKPLANADAILVLGGSAEYVARTHEAAEAWKEGIAPKILLTNDGRRGGWIDAEKRNPRFVERAFAELLRLGVPADNIEIIEQTVHGTDDEANLIIPFAAERKLRSLLLVTSPYHSRRAFWTFHRASLRNDVPLELGVRTPDEGYRYPNRLNWWMSLYGWRSVGVEYVKFGYYWLYY